MGKEKRHCPHDDIYYGKTVRSELNIDDAIRKLTELNGSRYALVVGMEELVELAKELAKSHRGFDNRDKIVEELADVELILVQIRQIFNILHPETDPIKQAKLEKAIRVSTDLQSKRQTAETKPLIALLERLYKAEHALQECSRDFEGNILGDELPSMEEFVSSTLEIMRQEQSDG